MNQEYIVIFAKGCERPSVSQEQWRNLYGNKGAGLLEMSLLGLPVPPGFIISTEVCRYYFKHKTYPYKFTQQVETALGKLEELTGKKFGSAQNLLLVSVRSGAAVSMPGMMDTILNLGINDEICEGLSKIDGRFAYDVYRRFIAMFAEIVLKANIDFDEIFKEFKKSKNKKDDTELTQDNLKELVQIYKERLKEKGIELPSSPIKQLFLAIEAVFNSWNNERAIVYRKLNSIPDDLGTAIVVQSMIFGNLSNDSATGVVFTRNPSTGKNTLFGEYLTQTQGEDIVAGIRTPKPISLLKEHLPEVYDELLNVRDKLESYYKDMQDIEFTIERGKLYLLQTRTGKCTSNAAITIAVDMANEGLITQEEAILKIKPQQIQQLLHKQIDEDQQVSPIAHGIGASPGAAAGAIALTPERVENYKKANIASILVRKQTSPEDIAGMAAAEGILTVTGGMTSHAAVVARAMGKPCVVGCEEIEIKEDGIQIGKIFLKEGTVITIDGTDGRVMVGELRLVQPQLSEHAKTLLSWADKRRKLRVRANADTPTDVATALKFGAEGIGLCRSEHMFFQEERIELIREMILAKDEKEREIALNKLLPLHRQDFIDIFKELNGLPVTIRLFDPPLHEFLPKVKDLEEKIRNAKDENERAYYVRLLDSATRLFEYNPMLGFRGCRLGIVYPQITRMQVRAIFEAAISVKNEGYDVSVEIMVPLVSDVAELNEQLRIINEVAQSIQREHNTPVQYSVGTMIELPRACICADKIAKVADFFSFGTNDLTQTTYGLSRDDTEGKFLSYYLEAKIFKNNPFEVLDREGVGQLMELAIFRGKQTNANLKVGICGEHGGEPSSIEFCHTLGLDYVSCSPYRVPVARLSAAQAALKF